MKNPVYLSCICLLLLVTLVALPVLAATVSCPPSCSCLLPAEAKKLGYPGYCSGKQVVCGNDMKNEKYCYTKPVTTTTVPQLIITAKPFVTTTPTTVPPQKCASGCTCLSSADGKGNGLLSCGGKQTPCGNSPDGTPLYCFARATTPATTPTGLRVYTTTPTTVPTPVTGLHAITPATPVKPSGDTPPGATWQECPAGCSCLSSDNAGAERCSAASAACGNDPLGRPMYCYVADRAGPVPAGTTAVPLAGQGQVPAVPPAPEPVPARAPLDTIFAPIVSFLASLFGSTPAGSTPPRSSSLQPVPCNGILTSLMTDPDNCGSCGVVCGSGSCVAGQCRDGSGLLMACGPQQANCDGSCKNVQRDEENCGSCGNVCPGDTQCCSGRCIPRCLPGETCIDGSCRNTSSDPSYCGETWQRCGGGRPACCNGICADFAGDELNCGECGYACGSGDTCCRGLESVRALRCANLDIDPHNCGRCGNFCGYGDEWKCCRGTCCNGTCCNGACCDTSVEGTICCAGGCANLRTDEQNCGRCGDRCLPGAECYTDRMRTSCRWHLGLVSLHCNDAMYQHDSVLIMVDDTDRSWEDSYVNTGDTETIATSIGTAYVPSPAVVHLFVNDHDCGDLRIDITDAFDFDEDLTHTFSCRDGIYDARYTLTYRVYYHED